MINFPAAFIIWETEGNPNSCKTFNAAHSLNSEIKKERPRNNLYAFFRVCLPTSKINP